MFRQGTAASNQGVLALLLYIWPVRSQDRQPLLCILAVSVLRANLKFCAFPLHLPVARPPLASLRCPGGPPPVGVSGLRLSLRLPRGFAVASSEVVLQGTAALPRVFDGLGRLLLPPRTAAGLAHASGRLLQQKGEGWSGRLVWSVPRRFLGLHEEGP